MKPILSWVQKSKKKVYTWGEKNQYHMYTIVTTIMLRHLCSSLLPQICKKKNCYIFKFSPPSDPLLPLSLSPPPDPAAAPTPLTRPSRRLLAPDLEPPPPQRIPPPHPPISLPQPSLAVRPRGVPPPIVIRPREEEGRAAGSSRRGLDDHDVATPLHGLRRTSSFALSSDPAEPLPPSSDPALAGGNERKERGRECFFFSRKMGEFRGTNFGALQQ